MSDRKLFVIIAVFIFLVAEAFIIRQAFSQQIAAQRIERKAGQQSTLDLFADNPEKGYLLRLWFPDYANPQKYVSGWYVNAAGHRFTALSDVISGHYYYQDTPDGRQLQIRPPSGDSTMLGIWADTDGGIQVRSHGYSNPDAFNFSSLDEHGAETFTIHGGGGLRWGPRGKPNMGIGRPEMQLRRRLMDTGLDRTGVYELTTHGTFKAQTLALGDGVSWTRGEKLPPNPCRNGSLFSRLSDGQLFYCHRKTWRKS